jgi:glycosyltransferase involved in cell wall biosynthesis
MLHTLFPLHFKRERISYCCWHLSRTIDSRELPVRISVPSYSNVPDARLLDPLPLHQIWRLAARFDRDRVSRLTEWSFVRKVREGDPVYLWTNVSNECVTALREKKAVIFKEKVSSSMAEIKAIMDQVYDRLGMAPHHGISDEDIAREHAQNDLVDYLFVANPIAAEAYAKHGVAQKKIVNSSYGWDPAQYGHQSGSLTPTDARPFTVVFVGVASIQKGMDILLKAWVKSKTGGRLILVGSVAGEVEELYSDILARDDISITGWINDPSVYLRQADLFIFPTYGEGGPLVTYEAMGLGLPVLTSPYGAGAVARHNQDGLVLDSTDSDVWAEALNLLSQDRDMCRQFAANAQSRAQEFTWAKVGERRRKQIISRTEERRNL